MGSEEEEDDGPEKGSRGSSKRRTKAR